MYRLEIRSRSCKSCLSCPKGLSSYHSVQKSVRLKLTDALCASILILSILFILSTTRQRHDVEVYRPN